MVADWSLLNQVQQRGREALDEWRNRAVAGPSAAQRGLASRSQVLNAYGGGQAPAPTTTGSRYQQAMAALTWAGGQRAAPVLGTGYGQSVTKKGEPGKYAGFTEQSALTNALGGRAEFLRDAMMQDIAGRQEQTNTDLDTLERNYQEALDAALKAFGGERRQNAETATAAAAVPSNMPSAGRYYDPQTRQWTAGGQAPPDNLVGQYYDPASGRWSGTAPTAPTAGAGRAPIRGLVGPSRPSQVGPSAPGGRPSAAPGGPAMPGDVGGSLAAAAFGPLRAVGGGGAEFATAVPPEQRQAHDTYLEGLRQWLGQQADPLTQQLAAYEQASQAPLSDYVAQAGQEYGVDPNYVRGLVGDQQNVADYATQRNLSSWQDFGMPYNEVVSAQGQALGNTQDAQKALLDQQEAGLADQVTAAAGYDARQLSTAANLTIPQLYEVVNSPDFQQADTDISNAIQDGDQVGFEQALRNIGTADPDSFKALLAKYSQYAGSFDFFNQGP